MNVNNGAVWLCIDPINDMAAYHSGLLATSLVIRVKEFSKLVHCITIKCMVMK